MPNKKKTTKSSVKKKTSSTKKTKETAEKKPLSKTASISILLILIMLFIFSLMKVGKAGLIANNLLSFFFSRNYVVMLITFMYFLVRILLRKKENNFSSQIYIGLVILNLTVMISCASSSFVDLSDLFNNFTRMFEENVDFGGGLIGTAIYTAFVSLFSDVGTSVVIIVLYIVSILLIGTDALFSLLGNSTKSAISYLIESVDKFFKEQDENKKNKVIEEKKKQKEIQSKLDEATISSINKNETFINLEEKPVSEAEDVHAEDQPKTEISSFNITDNGTENVSSDKKDVLKDKEDTHNISAEPKVLHRADPFKGYKLPVTSSLLKGATVSKSNKNQTTAEARGRKLIEILANFGVPATLLEYHIGPSVTKFEIKPDPRVQLSKINSLADNIKMELAAKDIRIEAPIPGKNAVGVEVPNAENTMVRMAELINSVPAKDKGQKLLFALGKDLSGVPTFCRLDKMPHLLIAGATGSGKSVCINTIITSYLLRTKPDEVKLVLVDPKKVEFTPYHDIPHLLWPVITDSKMAALMLKKVVAMMDERYDLFSAAGVREINSYNEKVVENNKNLKEDEEPMKKLPYIVVIIDELADLMQVASKDVEGSIQRITQLARASGIHLIVATQRPSTDVITGLIKSNMPSRISFAVSSSIDSRTILDQTGAERLLGNGDMLYAPQGENAPIRLQGCYVTDDEIVKVTEYCKSQAKPDYDDTYFEIQNNSEGSGGSEGGNAEKEDDLYHECVEFVAKTKKASTSSLQRRFGIGYNRAARIIDSMEENGLIGPANGSKPREVYIREQKED